MWCSVACAPLPTCAEGAGGTPGEGQQRPRCWGPGAGSLGRVPWLAALIPLLPLAGVTGILATELFDQTARPAAYMVFGALVWTTLFLVGLGFPFFTVGPPSGRPASGSQSA